MKKFLIVFLTLVLILGAISTTMAQNDYVIDIGYKLNEIEKNIEQGNTDAAQANLTELRVYVYNWARELVKEGRYSEQLLDIITFAAKAIETDNVEYINQAHMILDIFNKNNIVIEKSNHS